MLRAIKNICSSCYFPFQMRQLGRLILSVAYLILYDTEMANKRCFYIQTFMCLPFCNVIWQTAAAHDHALVCHILSPPAYFF